MFVGVAYLHFCPVMCKHHPDVLQAHKHCHNHPEDEQATVPQVGSKYQNQAAANTKECIKDSILDDRSNAHILITFELIVSLKCSFSLKISDNVEDGCDDGDDELAESNDQN